MSGSWSQSVLESSLCGPCSLPKCKEVAQLLLWPQGCPPSLEGLTVFFSVPGSSVSTEVALEDKDGTPEVLTQNFSPAPL